MQQLPRGTTIALLLALGAGSVQADEIPERTWSDLWDRIESDHDIALVELPELPRWPGTDYHDYLRVYQEDNCGLPPYLELYGQGPSFEAPDGAGTLRVGSFEVTEIWDYRIHFEQTTYLGICRGDSGGPLLTPGHDLIVCVQSAADLKSDLQCGPVGPSGDARCARTVRDNLVPLLTAAHAECSQLENPLYRYTRCFPLPFVNDIPGEDLDLGTGVAIATLL